MINEAAEQLHRLSYDEVLQYREVLHATRAELHRLSPREVLLFSEVIDAFYARRRRAPRGIEYVCIIALVRMMALAGVRWLH